MTEQLIGASQLQARLRALQGVAKSGTLMKKAGAVAIKQMELNMPRKTGITAATLRVEGASDTGAEIWGSRVVRWLDEGTGLYGPAHRLITPQAAKALAFHSQGKGEALGASYRLSGRMRVASVRKFGAGADLVVVRSVKGMHARPFIARSTQEAGQKLGLALAAEIVSAWDKGAAA